MVISKKKYIWIKHLGLLLMRNLSPWFINFMDLFMVLNNIPEFGSPIQAWPNKFAEEICPRYYVRDNLLNAKLVDTLMDPNIKLLSNQGKPLSDPRRYKRLTRKLNYLNNSSKHLFCNHWDVVIQKYIKCSLGKQCIIYVHKRYAQIFGYSKDDWVVCPLTSYPLLSIRNCILPLIWFSMREQKNIKIDYHFVREKIEVGDIITIFINSEDQLTNVFIESLKFKYVTSLVHMVYLLK
ncbi:hypothetical protein CR513_61984, partial [Mucuna pruriens]